MECRLIGRVSTPFETRTDAPRQGEFEETPGRIHVDDEFRAGLTGFEPNRDVVVVWWAHEATRDELISTKRNRGVFTTRSPARPNPLCITTCHVEAVDLDAGVLDVTGVDMVDGSPVLDLKPALY